MGRPTRFKLPGIPQLITQRGHNRLPCFLDGADYHFFKDTLWASADLSCVTLHGVLMLPQAYWVLASPLAPDSISRMIQRTGRCYVRHCNNKYRREGTLWAGRYQACLVEPTDAVMGRCADFLAATPRRAGLTAPGNQWPWLFLDMPCSSGGPGGDNGDDEASYEQISSVLQMGLVLGSDTFCHQIARQVGVKTTPGLRGRPQKCH